MEIITKQATTTAGEQKGIKKKDGKRGYVVRPLKGFGASFGES